MRVSLRLSRLYDGLVYVFDATCGPPAMRAHSHRELEMNLVIEGALIYHIAGRRQKLVPGCMMWLRPGLEHQVLDRSPNCRMLVAAFKPAVLRRLRFRPAGWSVLRRHGYLIRNIRAEDGVFLSSVGRQILDGQVDHARLNAGLGYGQDRDVRYEHAEPALLNSGLHFLLTASWQAFQAGTEYHGTASLHPVVARAIKHLQEASGSWTLPHLARVCGSSPAHLSRLFHDQTGVRLAEYRNTLRIERFFAIYGDGAARTALEACFAAGFGSYAQFSKVFRKKCHRSPSSYARSLRFQRERPR